MTISVYLQDEVHSILTCFGKLDDVVNNILLEADNGNITVTDKPNYGSRENSKRYDVNVTNKSYINLLSKFPVNSSRISLRRLLNWFVYEEVYELLSWKMVNKYVNKRSQKIEKLKSQAETYLMRLLVIVDDRYKATLQNMLDALEIVQ